jgi:hypothetical protein
LPWFDPAADLVHSDLINEYIGPFLIVLSRRETEKEDWVAMTLFLR